MVGASDRIVPSNVVRSRNCCDVSANGCDVVALRCVAAAGGPGLWLHRDPDSDSRSTAARVPGCAPRLRGLAQLTRRGCDAASSPVTAERGVSMSSTSPAVVAAPCGRTSFASLNYASSASGISEVSMSSSAIAAISANRFLKTDAMHPPVACVLGRVPFEHSGLHAVSAYSGPCVPACRTHLAAFATSLRPFSASTSARRCRRRVALSHPSRRGRSAVPWTRLRRIPAGTAD